MSVRQRKTFHFAADDQEGDHVMDEQEQEELLDSLKSHGDVAARQYMFLGQIVLGLSALLHVIYLFKWDKSSPLYAVLSSHPSPSTIIPLPDLFAALNIALHANLSLLLLPPDHRIRQSLSSLPPPLEYYSLPLPILHPLVAGLTTIAPALSLLRQCSWPDVAWWSATAAMSWFVYSVHSWAEQTTKDIRGLEDMRYDARSA